MKYWNWQDEKTVKKVVILQEEEKKENELLRIRKLMKQKSIGIEVSKLDRRF